LQKNFAKKFLDLKKNKQEVFVIKNNFPGEKKIFLWSNEDSQELTV